MRRLDNMVALVTGAAGGIGQGIARAMAEEGARLVLWDLAESVDDAAELLRSGGCEAMAQRVDVTDAFGVAAAVRKIHETAGAIDILVNNAGIARFAPFLDMTDETRDAVMNVNFNGPWNCTRAVLPEMIQKRYGRIINMASVTGPRVGDPGLAAYAASKAAICGLTRTLALEVAGRGITVNAVLPGFIDTPLIQPLADELKLETDEARRLLAEANPMKRIGTPEEIGHLCVFLASGESGYITGQEFVIDGGNTVLEKR